MARLTQQYQKVSGAMTVQFDGTEQTLARMGCRPAMAGMRRGLNLRARAAGRALARQGDQHLSVPTIRIYARQPGEQVGPKPVQ